MKKEKIEEFKRKLGLGADAAEFVESIIARANEIEESAIGKGVRYKEVTPEAPEDTPISGMTVGDLVELITEVVKKLMG